MVDFFKSLSLFQQIVFAIVAPATVILFLQFLLLLIGLGSSDADTDADTSGLDGEAGTDGAPECDADCDCGGIDHADGHDIDQSDSESGHEPYTAGLGLKLFTLRGILAFLAIGGWTALLVSLADSVFWSIVAGLLAGALADIVYGLLLRSMTKLSESGNLDIRNAIGKTGEVYIPVTPRRSGFGKVNITLQGRFCELDALSDSGETIRTGSKVWVTGVEGNSLVVLPEETGADRKS